MADTITLTQPKFSVIVPAHNSAEYIRRGLDSVLAQTYTDYELIVICDACFDNTEQIAREYTDIVRPVRFGLDGMARNAGLDLAKGERVLFLDDDDWFLHEYVFEQLAESTQKVDVDVLLFSFIWKGIGYTAQSADRMFFAVWNKMWRRDFIGETRFPAKPYWSDKDFHVVMMQKHPTMARWDMPMYYYNYLRPGSISWRQKQGEIE